MKYLSVCPYLFYKSLLILIITYVVHVVGFDFGSGAPVVTATLIRT